MSLSTKEQDLAKSRGRPEGLPKRWSAQRKAEVVLRLLRGEDIGEVKFAKGQRQDGDYPVDLREEIGSLKLLKDRL